MKKIFYMLLLFILSVTAGLYSYYNLAGKWLLAGIFVSGIGIGMFLMLIRLNVKNKKINLYKRELEKESLESDANLAKVKVLESKIAVLEKALENALNK